MRNISKPINSLKYTIDQTTDSYSEAFPFSERRRLSFYTARYALAAGIRGLGLKPENNVLVPAYNCGAEIDPVKANRTQLKYYKVRKNLTADLDSLRDSIDKKTKALLITHYFGFPQPLEEIQEICGEHNLFLIEDCAHAFLSSYYDGRPLGSFGDISIFSFRKTVPVPNGGCLVINNDNVWVIHPAKRPNFFSTHYVFAEQLKVRMSRKHQESLKKATSAMSCNTRYFLLLSLRVFIRLFNKIFNVGGTYLAYPGGIEYRGELLDWGMSALSKEILNSTDFEKVRMIRRRNFKYLLDYFNRESRFSLPIQELPDSVCPLIFPLLVENRDEVYSLLKKRGVSVQRVWANFHSDVPWEHFPEAEFLKLHVLGLPVHQDLSLADLENMLKELEEVCGMKVVA
jgi:dTDP-4-amino-4,6-dideoxygalactose transaminase